MKLFMHWDMEGISGLFAREQAWFWEQGVRPEAEEEGRRLLTADVNAAVAAALRAGADELIVCDTHCGGGNLILDQVLADPRVTYLEKSRGYQDGRLRWMPGLDQSVDGFLLPGHHAKAGTAGAFLPHTWMLEWADFRINGQSVGEMGIEACFAGHWDIPVLFVQGDVAACREAERQFPGIATASVKRAESFDLCSGPYPEAARRLTARKVAEAVANLRADSVAPYKPALPMAVTVRFRSVESAEAASRKPGVERLDELTVAASVERQCDVVRWIVDTGL
ncbi:MAG: hypothetical protein COZ06_18380 [Armatimonadetes bacterium CG_4_10_14_3_um_filter_66_18]|nr:M55 family metallopeptidase [Armatimonadota bacterium]OIO91659.1 MAG: hypothetical protein AUJ96_33525 [Armatimonadetes bacterium CG2_30_66_41]PIW18030.1 MAG: hypothetical protein COW34_04555 [Armatimonadetes bacterium CG17_big_fil_post_rev_8_21_14_2_50_66_6]PIX50119.1 MAG: hypothetical protein COZ57_00655 [Armatimonadetes bacterium CG_4_8_14_3_um_filter_66_20]PIY46562.1 MAG: hypothetical protein COZ06_18380 [Armatimonadetes bacterium CG_4_10_14_3_um_filter_66_18]PIZ31392.1 MAG: hypothetica